MSPKPNCFIRFSSLPFIHLRQCLATLVTLSTNLIAWGSILMVVHKILASVPIKQLAMSASFWYDKLFWMCHCTTLSHRSFESEGAMMSVDGRAHVIYCYLPDHHLFGCRKICMWQHKKKWSVQWLMQMAVMASSLFIVWLPCPCQWCGTWEVIVSYGGQVVIAGPW